MAQHKDEGKPVEQLTPDELQREHQRCTSMIRAFGETPAAARLRKRLTQIEKRMPKGPSK